MTKICKICGREFVPYNFNQKCCSKECMKENKRLLNRKRPDKKRTCVVCGREFTPRHGNQKCCSPECSHERDLKRSNKRYWDNREYYLQKFKEWRARQKGVFHLEQTEKDITPPCGRTSCFDCELSDCAYD